MSRAKVVLAGLLIAVTSFAAMPSNADGLCYNLKVSSQGTVLINQWVGVCSTSADPVSVTTQRIGDTVVQTTRYA